MIKQLQKRFITIIMSFVFVILVAVFATQNYTNYQKIQSSLNMSLNWALSEEFEEAREFGPSTEKTHMAEVITIEVDEDGTVTKYQSGMWDIDDETAQEMADSIDGTHGEIFENIFYKTSTNEETNTTIIAIVDASRSFAEFYEQLWTSVEIGVAAFIAFFVLAYMLSKWIIRPIQESWDRQKRFVADASHELKTPLTVVLANSDILLQHQEDTISDQKQWVTSIQDEALRMKKLVEDLLFLAKNDANRIELHKSDIDFSDLLFSTCLSLEPIAFEQGLLLEQDIEDDIHLEADSNQMKQFIMIFLDNAIKYTPKGHSIFVTLKKKENKIHLAIRNEGSYISQEDIDHLFERFYRVDKSREYTGGYGLGLSIAQEIAQSNHIQMQVTSDEKEGTCFSFVI